MYDFYSTVTVENVGFSVRFCFLIYLIDWSPTDLQPRRERNFKNPPHRWDIFSMTGPWKYVIN